MPDLIQRIRQLSQPLTPQPTGTEPLLPTMAGIRAVLFDVYGTLIISGSGDISLTSGASAGDAATAALSACGLMLSTPGDEIVAALHATIRRHHASSPAEFPEVEIRDVWRETLTQLTAGDVDFSYFDFDTLAIEYECRVNPIWPMPGLAESLSSIRAADLKLGIVSNAQFFTPLAFPALAEGTLEELGFDPTLGVWSYEHLAAKPGRYLYEQAAASLAKIGITPAQTLYVGNDMRNDIAPAAAVGFRTALFAGDARSLRWRPEDTHLKNIQPDAVITDLRQILSILSLADG